MYKAADPSLGIARPPLPSHIEIQVSGYVPFIDAGLDGHADLDLALPHPSSQLSHLVEHHPVLTGREQLWTPVHEEAVDVESEVDFDALIESFPVDSADLHPWSTQALDPIEAAPTTEATELTGEPDSQHSGLLGSSQLTEIRNVATPGTDANYILTPEKTTGTGKQP